ncbi:MAG: Holliday junction branch migration DNA helicase RuvB [bacterium]
MKKTNEDTGIVLGQRKEEDNKFDVALRPKRLNEFVGQNKLKQNIEVFIVSAVKRKMPLDHCLFYGPPGLGKTTLAYIIAQELGVQCRATSGPVLERVGDLAAILSNLGEGDVLFIDEIHRLNHLVEEALYPVMESFELDIIIGQGPSAKTIKLPIPKFTLIGATTRIGLLTKPMRERFGIIGHLEFYGVEDLEKIVVRSAKLLEVEINREAAMIIAERSRGTPRIANRLLKRVRDFAEVKTEGKITKDITCIALDALEVDSMGLDSLDRRVLKVIIENFAAGPVGIETVAVAISEEIDTVSDVCEPYLIQIGFLSRTQRGRIATPRALEHMGYLSSKVNKKNSKEQIKELF